MVGLFQEEDTVGMFEVIPLRESNILLPNKFDPMHPRFIISEPLIDFLGCFVLDVPNSLFLPFINVHDSFFLRFWMQCIFFNTIWILQLKFRNEFACHFGMWGFRSLTGTLQ